jgi:hypothetical protein
VPLTDPAVVRLHSATAVRRGAAGSILFLAHPSAPDVQRLIGDSARSPTIIFRERSQPTRHWHLQIAELGAPPIVYVCSVMLCWRQTAFTFAPAGNDLFIGESRLWR